MRRELKFESLDEVAEDLRQLLANGYEPSGNWNLAQVSAHLHDWMRFPMDGFPKPPFPLSLVFMVFRNTIGPGQLRKIASSGVMKAGLPTAPETVAEPDQRSDEPAVEQLCATIERFKQHGGEFQRSPLFGRMDRETALGLQLAHCSLHLSFLRPKGSG